MTVFTVTVSTTSLIPEWAAAFAPPPDLRVSEWADRTRMLPETSAEPGQWRTVRVPFTAGIMDADNDPDVEVVVVMKSAQIAGSESLLNVIGYHVEHDPCAALLVQPTITMAEAFSKDRLAAMIRATPALKTLVREGRVKDADGSTVTHKIFPGGYLALAGANSPASLAQRPVRLLVADDVDRFPPVVSDEGDPLELAIKRTTTFWNRKVFIVSTPTLKDGRVDSWFKRSDQRRFFVPCPRCGRMDYITWNGHAAGAPREDPAHLRVAFDDRDPSTAHLQCPAPDGGGCGARIEDVERQDMIAAGEWRATAVAQEVGLVGFHVWEAYSPWVSLAQLVGKFLDARRRGRESLRVFVNTSLAEGWEDQAQRIEPQGLLARRRAYGGAGVEIPERACCLTAGADTQDDRFELLVEAWGPGEERWVVDWRRITGDPKHPETKAALLEALTRRYRHALGVDLPIHAACIDSAGHRTDDVYDFVLAHQHLRLFATIGRSGLSGKPLVGPPSQKRYGRNPRPVSLYTINVDDAKASVTSSLALEIEGPGYLHLPAHVDTIDESFVAQLTAEQLVTRYTKAGIAYQIWVQVRAENHALDCAVLALAALRLLRPNLLQMTTTLRAQAGRVPAPAAAAPPPAPPSSPPRSAPSPYVRRFSRSGYVNS